MLYTDALGEHRGVMEVKALSRDPQVLSGSTRVHVGSVPTEAHGAALRTRIPWQRHGIRVRYGIMPLLCGKGAAAGGGAIIQSDRTSP